MINRNQSTCDECCEDAMSDAMASDALESYRARLVEQRQVEFERILEGGEFFSRSCF